jgi:transcriptional regulator GlxA family with amidase domain
VLREVSMPTKLRVLVVLVALAVAPLAAGETPTAVAVKPAPPTQSTRNVVILLFDDVEALDFSGPFGVFTTSAEVSGGQPFRIVFAAEQPGLVRAHNGLKIQPDCILADCPPADVLVVPGGPGVFPAMQRPALIDYIRKTASGAEVSAAVCIGSLLLAKAGLLDDLKATTHPLGLDYLAQMSPKVKVVRADGFIDAGKVLTSSGVAAGIEMSLHLVSRMLGQEQARMTASFLGYPFSPGP